MLPVHVYKREVDWLVSALKAFRYVNRVNQFCMRQPSDRARTCTHARSPSIVITYECIASRLGSPQIDLHDTTRRG